MRPQDMTLEQLQEKETIRIAFQTKKAESAILKLSERAKNADEKEAERLSKIIATHENHKTKLTKVKTEETAMLRFNKFQEKTKIPVKIKDHGK